MHTLSILILVVHWFKFVSHIQMNITLFSISQLVLKHVIEILLVYFVV